MIKTLNFNECEHHGDLDVYKSDVVNCGGKVIHESVDWENEVGTLKVEFKDVDEWNEFKEKFQKTQSFHFVM